MRNEKYFQAEYFYLNSNCWWISRAHFVSTPVVYPNLLLDQ